MRDQFIPAALKPQDWRLVKANLIAILGRLE
jgi:hypothetical protein